MSHPRPASPPPEALPLDPLGLLGAVLKDTFRIDAFAKRGGFGVVYRAWHLLAKLEHPATVKPYDFGRIERPLLEPHDVYGLGALF